MPAPSTTPSTQAAAGGDAARRQALLWTPERVPLTVPLAGLGERALAYLTDLAVLATAVFAAFFVYLFNDGDLERDLTGLSTFARVFLIAAVVACVVAYDVVFEVFWQGQTPGKRALKLRVVRADGEPPDLVTALTRNVFRLLDFLPLGYGVGTAALFFTGTRRLGDLVAGTVVVSERAAQTSALAIAERAAASSSPAPAVDLTDAQVLVALAALSRTVRVDAATARVVAGRAAASLGAAGHADPRGLLGALVQAQAQRGVGVAGALARLDAAAASLSSSMAQLPAAQSAADAFAFDAALRSAQSELMRATLKDVPPRFLLPLSLLLLRAERLRSVRAPGRTTLLGLLRDELPMAVWAERGLVARAAAVLAVGGVLGGVVAFADADLARALVGDELGRQIEAGATWTNRIEEQQSFASTSAAIIVNNVGVGLRVFVLGLLGGVAALLGVFSNGVQLGAVFGYAVSLDTHATLGKFILAHGPVELTMICIAGAAGMCLGRALLSPGHRTRLEALRVEGARGVRLALAATVGFAGIGLVEGFVSPGSLFPWGVNAAVGVALWLLYAAWIRVFGEPRAATKVR